MAVKVETGGLQEAFYGAYEERIASKKQVTNEQMASWSEQGRKMSEEERPARVDFSPEAREFMQGVTQRKEAALEQQRKNQEEIDAMDDLARKIDFCEMDSVEARAELKNSTKALMEICDKYVPEDMQEEFKTLIDQYYAYNKENVENHKSIVEQIKEIQNANKIQVDLSVLGDRRIDPSILSKDKDISKDIKPLEANKSIDHLIPAYSNVLSIDNAIQATLKNANNDTKGYVYRIIRNNFLISNAADMTEDERKEKISQGMEKAQNAADNMIDERYRSSFLDAMKAIANMARKGEKEEDGTMDYGTTMKTCTGVNGNLEQITNSVKIMKDADKKAYETYKQLKANPLEALKYHIKWLSAYLT